MASKRRSGKAGKGIAGLSRRDFLMTTAVVSASAFTGCATTQTTGGAPQRGPLYVPPGGTPQKIRVGVIGCGGRGTGAAIDCVHSSPAIEIVAMGDLFRDRLDESRNHLNEKVAEAMKVTDDHCFVGFDAYNGVIASDLDLVILATPPHFRPIHLAAAVDAGKHAFMEKPVAVDPVGIRSVLASADKAQEKGLGIVAGTQRRHQPNYLEAMKRIEDGAIGEPVSAQCYWNQGELWVKERKPEYSDMEWQCRNWLYFCWLSGDHIVEQHVHNLDVVNWAMGGPPAKGMGMGGRQWRTDPKFGNIFDHFAIEYEYPNGARVTSMCRQIKGCADRVSEFIIGTKGHAYLDGGGNAELTMQRGKTWKYEAPEGSEQNPYVLEHRDLIASIRKGEPLNEARRVAESTMTAILGRMSAYTGREISWKWGMNASELDLSPPAYAFGDLPIRPAPMPGQTELV